jgi:hypothetical protein
VWHKGSGVVQYDPPRPGMKKNTRWWCVINVDREITRYYRWWILRRYHTKGLHPPSWDAHISVIRGERPPKGLEHLWKKYHGQQVEFEYKHQVYRGDAVGRKSKDGGFWQVEVRCPLGTQIRKEFGFPHNWPLHLTVGRTYY